MFETFTLALILGSATILIAGTIAVIAVIEISREKSK